MLPFTRFLGLAYLLVATTAHGQDAAPLPFLLRGVSLDVRVDYANGNVAGTETIRLRNKSTRPAAAIPLLLNRLMTVSRVTDGSGTTLALQQRFVLFVDDSLQQVNAIAVTLPHPLAPGDSIALRIEYGGHLVGYAETGSLYIRDHVDSAFTILRADAFAYPVLGVPSRAVNRATGYPDFAFDVWVAVPLGEVVATGGEQLASQGRDSLITWHYRNTRASPTLNIAIAPYRVRDRAGVRIFYFPQDSTGAAMVDQAIAGAVADFTAWFGPLGDTARITVIEIPEGWGSQASLAGGIIQTADAFRDRGELYQVYHELSHLWNVGDADRPSPRWNEGLAMFLQWRVAEQLDGWKGWDARWERMAQRIKDECAGRPKCATVPFIDYGKYEMTDLSYGVGMAMFYALYYRMGAERFDRAYGHFYQKYRRSGATSAELMAAFRAEDPTSDRIFQEWFTTTKWYARLAAGEALEQIVEGDPRR